MENNNYNDENIIEKEDYRNSNENNFEENRTQIIENNPCITIDQEFISNYSNQFPFSQKRCEHTGFIFFKISIFCLISTSLILLSSFLSASIVLVVIVLGVFLPLLTFGTIFVLDPNYIENLKGILNGSASTVNFLATLLKLVPYASFFGLLTSMISLLFLCKMKNKLYKEKIILCIVFAVFCTIVFVVGFILNNNIY